MVVLLLYAGPILKYKDINQNENVMVTALILQVFAAATIQLRTLKRLVQKCFWEVQISFLENREEALLEEICYLNKNTEF